MKFNIRGNKVEVTEPIKKYLEEKIGKLNKYFENPEEITANVVVRIHGIDQIVEVTIPIKKMILRAEERNKDLYSAIDLVIDKLERQIRKNKTKMSRKNMRSRAIEMNIEFDSDDQEENQGKIVRRKVLEMKPMSEEEAILQMDLLDHEFFVYKDDKEDSLCVLYKRKDGDYGLIETKI